jgi:hypothetical protein
MPILCFAYAVARAAECAAGAGRFKEFHDLLFRQRDSLGLKTFSEFAREMAHQRWWLMGSAETLCLTVLDWIQLCARSFCDRLIRSNGVDARSARTQFGQMVGRCL